MAEAILEKSIYLKADKALVWDYLTDPDKLAIWFHKPKATLTQGDDYALYGVKSGDKLIWGKVTEARPHDYLEYTFSVGPMGDAVTNVKWSLDAVAGGTRLSLVHDGIPQGEEAFGLILAFDKGWDEHMSRMREDIHAE